MVTARSYSDLEDRLRSLAELLPKPRSGDWLAVHHEPGQTFEEYQASRPIRKGEQFTTIFLCMVGDFSDVQKQVLGVTEEYLGNFFNVPVKVRKNVPVSSIPASAKRNHPSWGDRQLLSTYVLDDLLRPDRPANALAYLALTGTDLWPGEGWNFVFGQADLRQRTGVWSIYRNGDPAQDFKLCLRRTLSTASHETGHILGMAHCTAYHCLMNGSNHQEEKDRRPMHLCPVCLEKLCWNVQVEPVSYLKGQADFCRKHSFDAEAGWYEKAAEILS